MRPRTDRERELAAAHAEVKRQKFLLEEQRLRVQAAQRAVDRLSLCDGCGGKVRMAMGATPQLCLSCSAARSEKRRLALLAEHGYGPDGRKVRRAA